MFSFIDIGTLYLSTSIVAGFFGLSFLVFHFTDVATRGIIQWGLAYFLIAAGLIILLFRESLPLWLHGVAAHALFIAAAVLLDSGAQDRPRTSFGWLPAALSGAALVLLLFFSYAVPNVRVRLATALIAVAVLTSQTAFRLARQGRRAEERPQAAIVTFALIYTVLAAALVTLSVLALIFGPIERIANPQPIFAVLLPSLMLLLIGAGMAKLWVHYTVVYAEAIRAATIDPLTGVWNRRYIMPELERLFQRSHREGRYLACMMLDADAFKSINDSYGHRTGDDVLQLVAQRITTTVRTYDLVGRYGGEEFIVIVPELERDKVIGMADRIHASIRDTPLCGLRLTVSVGVAFIAPADKGVDDLIIRADNALYKAKREGRDRVAIEDCERQFRRPAG